MTKLPAWAEDLAAEVTAKYGGDKPPIAINWRRSRDNAKSTGRARFDRIVVTAGSERRDQRLVLLHELAHWIVGPECWHDATFWDMAWKLYREYNVPSRYALDRESRYRAEAVNAALRAGVHGAKSAAIRRKDLTGRLRFHRQPATVGDGDGNETVKTTTRKEMNMSREKHTYAPGTLVTARIKGTIYQVEAVEEDGKQAFRFVSGDGHVGEIVPSLSGASKAITGNDSASNVSKVWREGPEPHERKERSTRASETTEPKAKERKAKERKAKPKVLRVIKKARKQENVPDGYVRWFCSAGMHGFDLPFEDGEPVECPDGHAATAPVDPMDEMIPAEPEPENEGEVAELVLE